MNQPTYTHSRNPITGEIIKTVPLHTIEFLKQVIQEGRKAQKLWEDIPISQRIKRMKPGLQYLAENYKDIAQTISGDNGKTYLDALSTEVLPSALALKYYFRKAPRFLKPESCGTGSWVLVNKRSRVIRRPYGVLGIISPWNYPFSIAFSEVITGLLAGNAVILKAATQTQAVAALIDETIKVMDLPAGLFSPINMPGKIVGEAFLDHGIDKLFFTGSVAVGKRLMAKAAENLTPVNLELGGNDAMIVRQDANLERAANGALWAGFQNAGQSCGGVERIYVHYTNYEPFLEKLKEKIENLQVGPAGPEENQVGCLTTENQANTVRTHIDEALQKGAQIYAQSTVAQPHNLFIPATVLVNVDHSMQIMHDETFGPVVGVMPYKNDEEAIKLANDSYLGLTASIWTGNRKKGRLMASQINAGVVTINDHLMSHGLPETSWGGFKQSGIGRTHGKQGFHEMTQSQFIVDDVLSFLPRNIWWHPHTRKTRKALEGLMNMLFSSHIGLKISGIYNLVRYLPKLFDKTGSE